MICRSHIAVPLITIIILSPYIGYVKVDAESEGRWINVLSDPDYSEDVESCNESGTASWCVKDWNCSEKSLCEVVANDPSITIRNGKTLEKFPIAQPLRIAYKGVLQGCSASFECSKGYSSILGLNVPVNKLLEFSTQHPPEITIGVSKLSLGGPSQGILTDLWFVDQESKVLLVIDVYWQRSDRLQLPPIIVLEEDRVGTKYKTFHYWEQPECLRNNSDQYQSCTLSVSDLLRKASNAIYNVAKCMSAECVTADTIQGSFDYSRFVLQEIDAGIELLYSPWGEATATVTYSQLKYWAEFENAPGETEPAPEPKSAPETHEEKQQLNIFTERTSYTTDELVTVYGFTTITGKGVPVRIDVITFEGEIYATLMNSDMVPKNDGTFTASVSFVEGGSGIYTLKATYLGATTMINLVITDRSDSENVDNIQAEDEKQMVSQQNLDVRVAAKQLKDVVIVRVRNMAGSTEEVTKVTVTLPDSTLQAYKGTKLWEKNSFIQNSATFQTAIDPIKPGGKAIFLLKVDSNKPLVLWEAHSESGTFLAKGTVRPLVFD